MVLYITCGIHLCEIVHFLNLDEINQFVLTLSPIGAGFGLQLTLNIEQYEYIQGPSTDAGIKVCIRAECRQLKDII